MKVSKKENRILNDALSQWAKEGALESSKSQQLQESLEVKAFDWHKMARYSFWSALICILISVSALIMDDFLIDLFKRLFNTPPIAKSISLVAISAVVFLAGLKMQRSSPGRTLSHDAIFFLGVVSMAGSIAFLGEALDTGNGHFSLLLLLAALAYGCVALLLPSNLVWLFSLLSLASWFGAETGYISGWGAYYLGMNFPLRFVAFGLCLILLSYLFSGRFSLFRKTTRVMGLLYLFLALWIMSIFGNYGDIDIWRGVKQIELFHWSLLFAIASGLAIVVGVKTDDAVLRGFGLTFLFINLYTRFFEFFWDGLHKALFFGLLGISLWLVGRYAEKLWLLGK